MSNQKHRTTLSCSTEYYFPRDSIPMSASLMLEKLHVSLNPHKRKKMELACVVHAVSVDKIAYELEELARRLREDGLGWIGHGSGYYASIAYASCVRRKPVPIKSTSK